MTDKQKERLEELQNKGKLTKKEQEEYQKLCDMRYSTGEAETTEEAKAAEAKKN